MASIAPSPHRFSVDEYHRMAEAGLFGPDDRLELVEGEVIDMAPIGSRHAALCQPPQPPAKRPVK